MDGSADLKWRLYQSRRGTSGSGRGRNLPGFSGGYNSNIPYNSWSSATDIRVPRYADCTHSYDLLSFSFFTKTMTKLTTRTCDYSSIKLLFIRYFYDGGPDLTSTILTQCWRLVYLNCLKVS